MARLTLDDILNLEDHQGLLDVRPVSRAPQSVEARLAQDFEEISRFVDLNDREPGQPIAGGRVPARERMLAMRLKAYRGDAGIVESLSDHDRHGLLAQAAHHFAVPASVEDILASGEDILSPSGEDIFTLKHARPRSARPDKVSERRPAADFAEFKPLFDKCVSDLVAGRRRSLRFANEQEINAGDFFILNGVMVYVAEVNDPHFRNGKRNARLRLIFENGTEGENLLRSLATELYKDPGGRRITDPDPGPLFREASGATDDVSGCIYVVRSLSQDPTIKGLTGRLFKIGFTSGSFEERIRSAKDDPTFLLAAVQPVRTYEAKNINLRRLEYLLHYFFGERRLDIELPDRFGKPFKPREWFVLPLSVIEQAIPMIIDGSIVGYRYDARSEAIVRAGD